MPRQVCGKVCLVAALTPRVGTKPPSLLALQERLRGLAGEAINKTRAAVCGTGRDPVVEPELVM